MNFDLNDDERLIADSVSRLLAKEYDFASRDAILKSGDGWSRDVWRQFAELGVLGLPFDEAHGGFGGGPTAIMIVGEAIGRVLALEPYLSTVILAGGAIAAGASDAQRDRLLPAIFAGETIVAFAHDEAANRGRIDHVETRATRDGDDWRLSGSKLLVLHGDVADRLVVTARDAEGAVRLFLVDAAAPGVNRRGHPLHDGRRAAAIDFDGAAAEPLGGESDGAAVLADVLQRGIAALCAETLGAMEAFLALTLDYLKTRVQFGRPIGSNQALQHRAVDLRIAVETVRSATIVAIDALASADAKDGARAIAQAKYVVGKAARRFAQEAVQLHGSIALTEEYAGSHYFRRLMTFEHLFGDTPTQLATLSASVE
ncbi:acyl-CoA dehydrogenase family protein [Sphingomonas sp.]|uniref:acyl-CoA dehydrogenase family protein n=1 Tax=Sphingomonas sp. TaxID=28214 RepID=UPI002DD63776|nr:acyl-CoA dehydrogenase family protein [Sphingomonas sp.]